MPVSGRLALALLVGFLAGGCATSRQQRDYDLRKAIATQLIDQRDWPAALRIVQQLRAEEPDDADVLVLSGLIFRDQGMREEAEADFRAALALKSEHAAAHSALAVLLDAGGGGEEALDHHRSAAELAPNSPQLLNNLGFALYVRGRHEEAIATLREALRLAPADSRVRNNLGFAYARAGDFSRAAREFSSAGTEAQAKNNLGFAYEQDGNLAAAYALYDEALRLDPQLEQARQNLAHVAEKLDRPGPKAVDSPLRSAGGTDASSTNAD